MSCALREPPHHTAAAHTHRCFSRVQPKRRSLTQPAAAGQSRCAPPPPPPACAATAMHPRHCNDTSHHHAARRRALLTGAGGGLALAGGLLVAGGVAAMAAAAASADPNALVRQGMNKFRDNDVEGSIQLFDAALEARPAIRPYLWQRGLSLYYVEQYQEGAQQVGSGTRRCLAATTCQPASHLHRCARHRAPIPLPRPSSETTWQSTLMIQKRAFGRSCVRRSWWAPRRRGSSSCRCAFSSVLL